MLENVKKFFEELESNDKALELLKSASVDGKEPDIAVLANAARETGYDVTDEEMRACCEEERKRRAAASDAVAEKLGELSPDEMELGVGGKGEDWCRDTYNDGEWCWEQDSCKVNTNFYRQSNCKTTYREGEWCWKQDSCRVAFVQYSA